jgi:hypothetical protein
MLRRVRTLEGFNLSALDGHAGRISDVYFDDQTWRVRYLVAGTGRWPAGIQVLIAPSAVAAIDQRLNTIEVELTRLEIERSPLLDSSMPAYAQLRATDFAGLAGPMNWGFASRAESSSGYVRTYDPHLRSARRVTGYRVRVADGELGHVIDLLLDDRDWVIPYLITDTTHWRMGRPRLLSTGCVDRIEVATPMIYARVSREALENRAYVPDRLDLPDGAPGAESECAG